MTDERTVIAGLPWRKVRDHVKRDLDKGEGGQDESWQLDVDGVFIWVKNYSTPDWHGWRVGRGGTPLLALNEGDPFATREEAMEAARKVAVYSALEALRAAHEEVRVAINAVKEVTLP